MRSIDHTDLQLDGIVEPVPQAACDEAGVADCIDRSCLQLGLGCATTKISLTSRYPASAPAFRQHGGALPLGDIMYVACGPRICRVHAVHAHGKQSHIHPAGRGDRHLRAAAFR
jgi:hypothetical protein